MCSRRSLRVHKPFTQRFIDCSIRPETDLCGGAEKVRKDERPPRNWYTVTVTGRCIHCLGYFTDDQMTDDHVVPDAWYPSTVPPRDRPVAPACHTCNQELSKIEGAMLTRLGLCFGPDDQLAGYFAKKAARSVNPRAGTNPKDAQRQQALGRVIISNWLTADQIASDSIIPGFERPPGVEDSDAHAIALEKALLDPFGEKLIRGSSYIFSGLYIEPGHEITVWLLPRGDNAFLQVLDKFGRCRDLAPGIGIRRAGDDPADPACGIFEFKFWDRFLIYGVVQPSVRPI